MNEREQRFLQGWADTNTGFDTIRFQESGAEGKASGKGAEGRQGRGQVVRSFIHSVSLNSSLVGMGWVETRKPRGWMRGLISFSGHMYGWDGWMDG